MSPASPLRAPLILGNPHLSDSRPHGETWPRTCFGFPIFSPFQGLGLVRFDIVEPEGVMKNSSFVIGLQGI